MVRRELLSVNRINRQKNRVDTVLTANVNNVNTVSTDFLVCVDAYKQDFIEGTALLSTMSTQFI